VVVPDWEGIGAGAIAGWVCMVAATDCWACCCCCWGQHKSQPLVHCALRTHWLAQLTTVLLHDMKACTMCPIPLVEGHTKHKWACFFLHTIGITNSALSFQWKKKKTHAKYRENCKTITLVTSKWGQTWKSPNKSCPTQFWESMQPIN
jgi:hypothetical protein